MRILYHHRTMAEDGQAVHIRALQRAFRELGHEVLEVSLVPQGDGDEPKPEAPDAESARSRWSVVSKLPRFVHELAEYAYSAIAKGRILRAAAGFEPDFVYERYAFGNAGGVLARKRLSCPLVLEVNSPMVEELGRTRGLSFPGLARRVETSVFRGADLVCVVTGVLGDMLVELGVERSKLLVTPNGVHLEQYAVPDPAQARVDARADLGLPPEAEEGAPVLGFVGYYRDWHRLDLVVRALARPELRDARLVLVGAGPAEEGLRVAARAENVEGRVHFAGPRPHGRIPALLRAFDVALVPAINPYASPLKLHEYMAAGLPTIAPDQPNLREVLVHEQNGWLVAPGDADDLGAALVRLAGDADLRARLGAAARDTIERMDLTWQGNARRVVSAVEALR